MNIQWLYDLIESHIQAYDEELSKDDYSDETIEAKIEALVTLEKAIKSFVKSINQLGP